MTYFIRRPESEAGDKHGEPERNGQPRRQEPNARCQYSGCRHCPLRVVDSDLGRFVALCPGDLFLFS